MTVTLTALAPATLTCLTTDTLPFNVEWADALASGESIQYPEATLYDNANNIAVNGAFSVVIGWYANAGSYKSQYTLIGSSLRPNHNYTGVVGVDVTGAAAAKHLQQTFTVVCPG